MRICFAGNRMAENIIYVTAVKISPRMDSEQPTYVMMLRLNASWALTALVEPPPKTDVRMPKFVMCEHEHFASTSDTEKRLQPSVDQVLFAKSHHEQTTDLAVKLP